MESSQSESVTQEEKHLNFHISKRIQQNTYGPVNSKKNLPTLIFLSNIIMAFFKHRVHHQYSELSNKHAANLILFEKIFLPTCLIRTYTFIYFQGKFLPTRLLEYLCLLILAEIPSYKIILSSFKLLFCSFQHFKEASMS